MAEQADAPEREDDDLELTEVVETPEGQDTEAEAEDQEPVEGAEPEDELEISFDGEAAPASSGNTTDLVRHLRAEIRKRDEENAALRSGHIQPQPQPIEAGPRPTLEDCEYDEDRFADELTAWQERKRQEDTSKAQANEQAQAEQARFGQKLQGYVEGQKALKAKDFEAAEAVVLTGLSQFQQAALIKAADDPAKVIYALGRHPERLKTLAANTDLIEFAVAVAKLEGNLKVTTRPRTPPDPDVPVRGAAPFTKGQDPRLERLEREAARTGDRTEVVKYRRELRQRAEGK